MKSSARWVTCAEYSHSGETEGEHEMRDFCSTCAPFWWEVPTCFDHGTKLNKSGYCKQCKRYYALDD